MSSLATLETGIDRQKRQGVLIKARHVSKNFGVQATLTQALADVSLEMRAGEATLLMGPSGSGKSTLLAILSGLLPPTEGTVNAMGEELWSLSAKDRHEFRRRYCGFVFQGFNLFPALSAEQQLEMVLRMGDLAPAAEARERSLKLLEVLDMADKAHLRPAEMSGGEKQRVAVARALIKDPPLFFADEPTASLDWARGSRVVKLLCDAAHDRKACVLMVSHDERLRSCADHVYSLEDGRLRHEDRARAERNHSSPSNR
jgi:putative ABC transport system ATP-binding protein